MMPAITIPILAGMMSVCVNLSALIDGEANELECVVCLSAWMMMLNGVRPCSTVSLLVSFAVSWMNFPVWCVKQLSQLIGEAIRRELDDFAHVDLSASIHDALAEPYRFESEAPAKTVKRQVGSPTRAFRYRSLRLRYCSWGEVSQLANRGDASAAGEIAFCFRAGGCAW